MKLTRQQIDDLSGLYDERDDNGFFNYRVLDVYQYGGRVYGTHSETSDHDFIVIYEGWDGKSIPDKNDGKQIDNEICNTTLHVVNVTLHLFSYVTWNERLANHKIDALECHFLQPNTDYQLSSYPFTLDKTLLRKEISSVASNSWVKCKKKLEVENDYYTGIKSLFHSFRIPMFGRQIARDGIISDYHEANSLWFEEFQPMLESRPTWEDIKTIYKPRHNELMTDFRKYAEKAL